MPMCETLFVHVRMCAACMQVYGTPMFDARMHPELDPSPLASVIDHLKSAA